jgi:hypothetical protein
MYAAPVNSNDIGPLSGKKTQLFRALPRTKERTERPNILKFTGPVSISEKPQASINEINSRKSGGASPKSIRAIALGKGLVGKARSNTSSCPPDL